jgi:hypothetical protein
VKRLAAIAPLILLAGCASFDFGSGEPAPSAPINDRAQLLSALSNPGNTALRSGKQQEVPEIKPAALLGASGEQVESLLGVPDALWTEGGHALWRYASTGCVVLLFVDPADTVQKVSVLRSDGTGRPGCERAISERVTGARTS